MHELIYILTIVYVTYVVIAISGEKITQILKEVFHIDIAPFQNKLNNIFRSNKN